MVKCLAQGHIDSFSPNWLGDQNQQLFGYWPNALNSQATKHYIMLYRIRIVHCAEDWGCRGVMTNDV